MFASKCLIVGGGRCTAGAVSLTQGAYGKRGNLELVACDASDGLWVFWFNSDLETDPLETPDVPTGTWSAGLSFAAGHRYVDGQILQSTLGPDHLEVLALDSDRVLQSWYWSPGTGFQRRTSDAATGVTCFGASHERGALHVTVEDDEDTASHLVSPPHGYPARVWLPAPDGPGIAAHAIDAVVAAGIAAETVEPGTARSAASTRRGGTRELTWRDSAGRIRHLATALD